MLDPRRSVTETTEDLKHENGRSTRESRPDELADGWAIRTGQGENALPAISSDARTRWQSAVLPAGPDGSRERGIQAARRSLRGYWRCESNRQVGQNPACRSTDRRSHRAHPNRWCMDYHEAHRD